MKTQEDLISAFMSASGCAQIEQAADQLADMQGPNVAKALLSRLGESHVQDDPDVEDAVCSALVRLGIMERIGNRIFQLRPRDAMPEWAEQMIFDRNNRLVPTRYVREP